MSKTEYPTAYEALGRFVESFEGMVHEARSISIRLLAQETYHTDLVGVALHHQVFTAKPIFEIWRALIIEIVNIAVGAHEKRKEPGFSHFAPVVDESGTPIDISPSDREIFFGVLKTIGKEYQELANIRNGLLHGTWWIGDPAGDFDVRKYSVTNTASIAD